jgi:hypothetical protein
MEVVLWVAGVHIVELLAIGIFFIIRKNKKLEEVIVQQQEQINTLDFLFSKLTTSLSAIDDKVWVEGDSELSEVFQDIKGIKETLESLYK